MCGKWRQMSDSPGDWGFDEYVTDPTAGGYFWAKSYTKNGQLVETPQEIYYPDVQQAFALDFITRHRDKPYYFYYSKHLVHGPIVRTPDSAPGAEAGRANNAQERPPLYNDNVAYLDKQVGQLVAELDRLGLRERTLIVFSTDNGTPGRSATIGGRHINGGKGTMLEGGSRVPLIASWKGTMPAGRVVTDLIDFTDILPTFGEIAGAELPTGVTLDGRSFAPQLRGETGNPRSWVFVQLGANWYARNDGWKLTQSGELFDMRDAPFVEHPIAADAADAKAVAARKELQAVLDQLDPKSGKVAPTRSEKKADRKAKRKAKNG
jgi:arylsulfatase A